MTHLVLMKYQPGFFDEACFQEISEAFSQLKAALPEEILRAQVYKNCVEREFNMDILIELELSRPESLAIYLAHPIHVAISSKMNPFITNRVSFDYE